MTMERFAAELDRKLKVKSMVEKFGVEKVSRTQASLECQPFQTWTSRNPGGEGRYVKVPVPGGRGGTHVDGNDDTVGHCVRGTRCGRVYTKYWTGA